MITTCSYQRHEANLQKQNDYTRRYIKGFCVMNPKAVGYNLKGQIFGTEQLSDKTFSNFEVEYLLRQEDELFEFLILAYIAAKGVNDVEKIVRLIDNRGTELNAVWCCWI